MCSCFYVLLWDNFICRMHLQPCITFHKINLSSYFLITVSSHLYTYPIACHQLVYELFVYWNTHTNTFFFNLLYNIAYTSFLPQTECCARYLLLAIVSSESSQVHRILPHHYRVWTERATSQHSSCSCSFMWKWAVVSVNHFALIEY